MPRNAVRRPPLRRISALDASNLRVESRGLPMTVAALATLEPRGGPRAARGAVDLEAVRWHVVNRVAREPRLRQVLLRTRWWQGPPVWVPDPDFDVASRVRVASVPRPHDEAALLRLCCDLSRPALDPAERPWELWLLSGRDDGSLALLLRLHHVLADGAAALDLFSGLFDSAPGPALEPDRMPGGRPPGIPDPDMGPPTQQQLLVDNLHRNAARLRRTGTRLRHALRPAALARRAVGVVELARLLLAHGRAPALSINQPVTAGPRELRLVRADLAAAKAAAHARRATVNDLLLAVVAHGVRALLEERGELVPGLVLHVSVPASLRPANETGTVGNQVAVRLMWVPLDEPDAARRLAALAPRTRAIKRLPPLQPNGALGQRWVVRVMRRQRLVNVILSNVVGPAAPLWFGSTRVRDLFQIGVAGVQGNLCVTVGALSYAGELNLDIASDALLVPDVDVFADGVRQALADLGCGREQEAGVVTGRWPPPT